MFNKLIATALAAFCLYACCCGEEFEEDLKDDEDNWPTIGVSILVRDKEHSLPYALTCLEEQTYPKDRLYVWFYIDNTVDKSATIVGEWAARHAGLYNEVHVHAEPAPDEPPPSDSWNEDRLKHLSHLREKALNFARKAWADFIFMLDADVLLIDPEALKSLVRQNRPIVAPMLLSDGLYSNFWGAMTENYYYSKSEEYERITSGEVTGCFEVPMVHSAVLVALRPRAAAALTYDAARLPAYRGPTDDIISFALSAKQARIPMAVCNWRLYGFVPIPVDMAHTALASTEREQLLNVRLEALSMGVVVPLAPSMARWVPRAPRDRLGLARVFLINLPRRTARRRLMEASLFELGVDADFVDAVDGKYLNMQNLSALNIHLMPGYEDPYHKRPMKAGEVGCFLSHFNIWKEVARRHLPQALVLEDDVHFTPFFRRRFAELLAELAPLDWDLVYIGRKAVSERAEEAVSARLVRPGYSYWTLGYLVSERGARKLIRAEPLAKLLPVDEFLPIMFDRHPNHTWKSFFPRRELAALSASPLLVFPTHYTGQAGYVSDTEDSAPLLENGEATPAHYEL